jgi:pimeloyl-ACP methyl ester carboxylesterase
MAKSAASEVTKTKTSVRVPLLGAHRAFFRLAGAAAPRFAARWAETLFRFPPRHRTSDPERRALGSGHRTEVSALGRRVAVWSWGSGPPVLLVHGWGSRGARLYSFIEPLRAAGFSVHAFDAPGHGESDGRLSSLPEFLGAIGAVARTLPTPLAGIVGHSIGGAATVLAVALGIPARRVVLLASSANPAAYTAGFARLFGIASAVRQRMVANLERRFGFQWDEFDAVRAAAALTAPALVFHDRSDEDVPWSDGAAIARAWTGAELVTTEGLGHRRIVHEPAVVARAVAFLAEGSRRETPPRAAGEIG